MDEAKALVQLQLHEQEVNKALCTFSEVSKQDLEDIVMMEHMVIILLSGLEQFTY